MLTTQNKKCGKCEKVVYPTEEIKCLDKFWHKGCLKCTVCGMTLNIKNVKGYDKMPYCNAHYPQPKATVVTDNPEMQRVRLLSDIQSNAKYHEDFNKSKGKFTVVADDPASIRAREQQRIVSQAEYTGRRKDSASQVLTEDVSQASTGSNVNTQTFKESGVAIERVADYDPMSDDHGSLAKRKSERNWTELPITTDKRNPEETPKLHGTSNQSYESSQSDSTKDTHHDESLEPQSHVENRPTQMNVRALYSYEATASDEVTFDEGDILVNCEHVDDGWMFGRNSKTGEQGLLPSNYVEIIHGESS